MDVTFAKFYQRSVRPAALPQFLKMSFWLGKQELDFKPTLTAHSRLPNRSRTDFEGRGGEGNMRSQGWNIVVDMRDIFLPNLWKKKPWIRIWSASGRANLTVLLLVAVLVQPVKAVDSSETAMVAASAVFSQYSPPLRLVIGGLATFVLVVASHTKGGIKAFLGPAMGVTTFLWVMMRTSTEVKPQYTWMVFGAWSVLTLTYLTAQTYRVAFQKLYILLTLTFAGICMCIAAAVQQSPEQEGLVTALPACMSFAAYAVSFFFPSKCRQTANWMV